MSIIIVGGGEIGQYIAEQLIRENKEIVIIEKNEHIIANIQENLDAKFILGNGAAPTILNDADTKNAEMVIAVTDCDEVNLLANILAGMSAPQAIRIARIRNPEFDVEGENLQESLGIDLVINPDKEAAKAIENILQVPGSFNIIDCFNGRIQIVGTTAKSNSPILNTPLKDLSHLQDNGHFLIAAIFRNNQLIVPTGDNRILEDDCIYFAAKQKYISRGMHLLGYKKDKIRNIMIYGADFIGRNLALELENQGINIKLIDPQASNCSCATRVLDKSVILNANGTDQGFLEEENINNMDAFISVTKDDEDNIISALLSKRLGCPLAIALSYKTDYQPLISAIGIDVMINPRQIANSTILHYIRKGKVIHASAIRDDVELIEIEALETSEITGKPLSQLKLPPGVLILSVKRNDDITVPFGDTIIQPGDHALILSERSSIAKLEKLLTVKLEYF